MIRKISSEIKEAVGFFSLCCVNPFNGEGGASQANLIRCFLPATTPQKYRILCNWPSIKAASVSRGQVATERAAILGRLSQVSPVHDAPRVAELQAADHLEQV